MTLQWNSFFFLFFVFFCSLDSLSVISDHISDTYLFKFSQKTASISCGCWDSPWESATEPEGVCSRWSRWTGCFGALKHCKPISGLVVREEDVSAAFFFLLIFFLKSPQFFFSAVFLLLRLRQIYGRRESSHHWPSTVLCREPTVNVTLCHRTRVGVGFFFSSLKLCIVIYRGLIAQNETTTTVSVWRLQVISILYRTTITLYHSTPPH